MTKEDKELLLKDLSGRIPYGVIIEIPYVFAGKEELQGVYRNYVINESGDQVDVEKALIYLRPISSMTEEERKEYNKVMFQSERYEDDYAADVDWLNAHHFDYRELIPKGLALEAPEGMYKNISYDY